MDSRIVRLIRKNSSPEGTFGDLYTDNGFVCSTGEPPWKDNQHNVSCVPADISPTFSWEFSEKHKRFLYVSHNINGRNMIEIHSGNFCGDRELGFVAQSEGCILLGASVEIFEKGCLFSASYPPLAKDQRGVSSSVITLEAFHRAMRGPGGSQESFILEIT